MSVLIKGMEMPDSCIACRFGKETNYAGDFEEKCLVNDKCGYVSVRKPRLDTCPLVEVKTPHGDLVDRQELIRSAVGKGLVQAWKDLRHMPAVIEAEGREE